MHERLTTITVRRLRDTPDAGLSGPTTPAARLALVETLTSEAWALAGGEPAPPARGHLPVRLRPLRSNDAPDRSASR